MQTHTLVQVSDTHLSAQADFTLHNWTQCVHYINEVQPDLVVHTGDIVLHDADDAVDQEFARLQLMRLDVPWRAVPGNHDVGDGPPAPIFGQSISAGRIERFIQQFGPDRWSMRLGEWTILGVNSLLFGSALELEEDQWRWLAAELTRNAGRPVALFFHKPPFTNSFQETDDSNMSIPAVARIRLSALLRDSSVRLLAVGHRHEYRTCHWMGITVVWAPTTAFLVKKVTPPADAGLRRVGCVEYRFFGENVAFRMCEPPGLKTFDNAVLHEHRRRLGLTYSPEVLSA